MFSRLTLCLAVLLTQAAPFVSGGLAAGDRPAFTPPAQPLISVALTRTSATTITYEVTGRGFVPGAFVMVAGVAPPQYAGSGGTWGYAAPDGTIDLKGPVDCPKGTPLRFVAAERTYDPSGNMIDTFSPILTYPAP
jgi:hypothetical protein